jgi:outer membrane cobalamin receptor
MRKLIFTRQSIVLYMIVFLNFSLYAQESASDTVYLDEVVVTGTKIEVSRKLVPVSVSQITKKEIENTGEINVLPTLSTYSPGVFITERNILGFGVATGGSGSISIRGVSGTPNTNVLVLIDGHPQYQGIFGHPLPDAYVASEVEKVEIIRGPASILYGSNAMAGVVNIITRQQHKDSLSVELMGSYGSYNTQQYYGTIGYKQNKFSVFASVNHDRSDGIRENTDFKITNGYTKIGYQINKHLNLTADLNFANYFANDNGSVNLDIPQPFSIDIDRGKTALSLENSYRNLDGALKFYHNFGTHDLSDGWYSTDRNSGLMLYQTTQLFKGNKLTAGFDAKKYAGEGNSGMARDSLITINEYAFYTYTQQTVLKKLLISAGLRWEYNSNYGNVLVPMAGINYNPVGTTTLRASVSKGFRSPTMMELYLFAPNPDLNPEQTLNYEASWLQSYFDTQLETELTLFSIEGENMIQVVGQYPNVQRQNVGSFANKGIEFAFKFKATEKLYFNGNYSYLNLNKPLLAAPKHQVNLSANYTYQIFNLNISLQHINDLYTNVNAEARESYTLLNARLNAKISKNVHAFFMGNNLLNEDYEINSGYPMPEINFSGGVKLTF